MSTNKNDIFAMVDGYLHGLLSGSDASYVEEQVEASPVWRAAMDEARKRLDAIKTLPTSEASESLIQATLRRIDHRQRRRASLRFWTTSCILGGLAAAVLVLAGLHIHYATLSPSPYDLNVVGQTRLLAGSTGSIRVRLVNHDTGQPVQGVPVEIELDTSGNGNTVKLVSFTTDQYGTGQPRITLPDQKSGEYELKIVAHTRGGDEIFTKAVKVERAWKLMLSSDKPVYQPGQTIHLRSLALRQPDLKPVAGQECVFSITDPRGNVIFKQRSVSSGYGIASSQCPLAEEIIEGAYTIACQTGDTRSEITIEIKKYVLPKFKIEMELDRPYYTPGQSIHGTITAAYFFGKPVGGAEIRLDVATTGFGGATVQYPVFHTTSAGKGHFELRLPEKLFGHEQDSGDAQVRITATLTDTAGQQQSRTLSRSVTVHPLRIEILPEEGQLVRDQANRVYVLTTYADGRAAETNLSISGIDHSVSTSRLGVAVFELTPHSENVGLTIRATDHQGLDDQRQLTLKCGQSVGDFLFRTDKAVYNGGDTITFTALGPGKGPVFVDIIKDGQTVLTQTVPVNNGRGEERFDLPPDLFGTLQLAAYRFDDKTALPIRKTRVIYVRQAQAIHIAADADRTEYRPGGVAKLQFRLSDGAGKPVVGAISLAGVDEAVFSVLNQMPGTEATFFSLEQEMLKPVFAIYPWSPELTQNKSTPETEQLERALFSGTAAVPVDRRAVLQRLVDQGFVTQNYLDVLNDPNLDTYLTYMEQSGSIDSDTAAALRGVDNGSHELIAHTYPAKIQQVLRDQQNGETTVNGMWVLLAVVAVVMGLVLVWLWAPHGTVAVVLLSLAIAVFLVGLLLPALGAARRTARQMQEMTELRGIESALELSGVKLPSATSEGAPTQAVRVRQWFPETLLWRPELITDEHGHASLDVDLADSITTWRLSASAVSADGRLGATESAIRVFQPFFVDVNLPVALTRGDQVAVPVVAYNYFDHPQVVRLSLDRGDWFTLLDEPTKVVELRAGEVRSVSFRIRAEQVGSHHFQVRAQGEANTADAVERQIEVVPDGTRVEHAQSGNLGQPVTIDLTIPQASIDGSVRAMLKLYPASFSQVVEGLDAIFQMPDGCFEQTSSTTYPNVLALDYLRRTKHNVPAVEAKALQYIQLGYQRLLGFEVQGGGFEWFGRSPANIGLTAYGLMEFQDMAKVYDVDPKLIDRTRQWLLSRRSATGTWSPESMLNDGLAGSIQRGNDLTMSTTAYVAWAVFGDGQASREAQMTVDYLDRAAQTTQNPYVLALVCNALESIDPHGASQRAGLARLEAMKNSSPDGKLVWWELPSDAQTAFYGSGQSGDVETTALAALAMIRGGSSFATAHAALAWLVQQKDAAGTWYSTQATVLAIKALLAGTGTPGEDERERQIELVVDGTPGQIITIPADKADVVKQLDLTPHLPPGTHHLVMRDLTGIDTGYEVTWRYHLPRDPSAAAGKDAPLTIDMAYDRTDLRVGNSVNATATVVNRMAQAAPMVMLDLPVPAGFAIEPKDFEGLVESAAIAKYQLNARSVIVYLRGLPPSQPLTLRYRLRATMPVEVTVPAATVYEYYNPETRGMSTGHRLTVAEGL